MSEATSPLEQLLQDFFDDLGTMILVIDRWLIGGTSAAATASLLAVCGLPLSTPWIKIALICFSLAIPVSAAVLFLLVGKQDAKLDIPGYHVAASAGHIAVCVFVLGFGALLVHVWWPLAVAFLASSSAAYIVMRPFLQGKPNQLRRS